MPIEIETIIEQMEWAASRGLAEFSTTSSGTKIHISRAGGAGPTSPNVDAAPEPAASRDASPQTTEQTIDAPMAGICHLSGESGGGVFVSVGDTVEVGQTICLIEAMKMMMSIAATASGTVKTILVEDGETVDAGSPLVAVQP